ncbi:site-specific integrase [Carboxylicivirga marina]|uniref:site-specific integrase n=1 Tax=Carboxylicivirga marina TaxID=2800988 RepID=UPI002596D001|nr:site-specific integrase [uncultured Carboxylicivirga sp.]
MAYYLRKNTANNDSTIICTVYHQGKQVNFSIGIRIKEEQWNQAKQLPFSAKLTSNGVNVTKELKRIEAQLPAITDKLTSNGFELTAFNYKREIGLAQDYEITQRMGLLPFFRQRVETLKAKGQTNWKVNQTAYKQLKEFKPYITWSEVNRAFVDDFIFFLQEQKNLKPSTILTRLKSVKACFLEAYKREIHNSNFRDFTHKVNQVDTVYLTEEELLILENAELEGAHNGIKIWFLIACETGLRYSDLGLILDANVHEHEHGSLLTIKTTKTNELVYIPYTSRLDRLVDKLDESKYLNLPTNQVLTV